MSALGDLAIPAPGSWTLSNGDVAIAGVDLEAEKVAAGLSGDPSSLLQVVGAASRGAHHLGLPEGSDLTESLRIAVTLAGGGAAPERPSPLALWLLWVLDEQTEIKVTPRARAYEDGLTVAVLLLLSWWAIVVPLGRHILTALPGARWLAGAMLGASLAVGTIYLLRLRRPRVAVFRAGGYVGTLWPLAPTGALTDPPRGAYPMH